MGSPISPCLAELVLEFVERKVFLDLKDEGIIVDDYFRYIDDSWLKTSHRTVSRILNKFNSIHERIQFTIEMEKEDSIAFLDVRVIREQNGELLTDWYHKDSWVGRYCNFRSFSPAQFKVNTITMLTNKVLQLAHPKYHQKNFDLISQVLRDNDYPQHIIDLHMNETIDKFHNSIPPSSITRNKKDKRFFSIPYNTVLFGKLKSLFYPYNIAIVASPFCQLGPALFTKLKDRIPLEQRSSVVYEVTCDCNAIYIGQTTQHLAKRINQHKQGDETHSALSAHLRQEQHQIDLSNVRILCTETRRSKLNTKEMIYIRTTPCINYQLDSAQLTSCYDNLITTPADSLCV